MLSKHYIDCYDNRPVPAGYIIYSELSLNTYVVIVVMRTWSKNFRRVTAAAVVVADSNCAAA